MEKWLILVVAALLCGCRAEMRPQVQVAYWDGSNFEDLSATGLDLTEKVEDWNYAVLEQGGDCRLDGIWQIKFDDEDVFIINNVGVECDIYHFHADGRYLNRIGMQGTGYDFVTALVPDSAAGRLYLLDIFECSVHQYRYDGGYLRSYKPYPHLPYVVEAAVVDSGNMLGYYGITKDERLSYFLADSMLVTTDTLDFYRVTSGSPGVLNFSRNAISVYGGHVLAIKPFCDTLFEYRGRRLHPLVYTRVGRSLPEGFTVRDGVGCMELRNRLDSLGCHIKSGIFETDRHIWVSQGPCRFMYDKAARSGIYLRDTVLYHPGIYPPTDFVGRKGNDMVCLVTGEEVLQAREKMEAAGIQAVGKLKALFDKADAGDQILCYYRFR